MNKKAANPPKPEFYRRLEVLCAQNGLSMAGLAEKIGLSNATASSWGRGVIPNGETVIKMAQELKTTTDYILIGSEAVSPTNPHEAELLNIFRELSIQRQIELLSRAYTLKDINMSTQANDPPKYSLVASSSAGEIVAIPETPIEGAVRLFIFIRDALKKKFFPYSYLEDYLLPKHGLDKSLPNLLRNGISCEKLKLYHKELCVIFQDLGVSPEDIDKYTNMTTQWNGQIVLNSNREIIDYIDVGRIDYSQAMADDYEREKSESQKYSAG